MKKNNHGFILPIFEWWIWVLNKVNCVERFKDLVVWILKIEDIYQKIKVKRITVDVFIFLKWIFLITIWKNNIDNIYITGIVIYLLFMNFHTYFYYHLWEERAIKEYQESIGRMKGRFIAIIQAFLYTIVSFGYLYAVPFVEEFKWSEGFSNDIAALAMSFSKSVGGSFEYATPTTNLALFLTASQIMVTFIFVAILFGKSMPVFNQGVVYNGLQK